MRDNINLLPQFLQQAQTAFEQQGVLDAVDWVFGPGSAARKGLDGDTDRDWHHEANRREAKGLVEIWPLEEPDEVAERDPWQAPVDREPARSPRRRLAKRLAKTIKGWIGRRMLSARNRSVEAGDILILVKRRDSFFDAVIRALWNEQVPVAGADRLKLAENIAVLDLVALAQFAIMPEDDHALACILKSPLLADPRLGPDSLPGKARRKGYGFDGMALHGEERTSEPLIADVRIRRERTSGNMIDGRTPFDVASVKHSGARRRCWRC